MIGLALERRQRSQESTMNINSLWDISQAPTQFSQLPDDDFLALLQKQFASSDPPNRDSPHSDDSSPSPPSNTDDASRRHSLHARQNDSEDAPLKRKASSDDMDPGPSSKNQHTGVSHPPPISTLSPPSPADDPNSAKKPQPSRRKSSTNSQVSPFPCPA